MFRKLLLTAVILSCLGLVAETAFAGVLLRSSRVRARVRVYTPRIKLETSTKKSTAVARAIQPLRRSDELGTIDDTFKLIKAQRKYEVKYSRWEQKRLRKAEKRRQKEIRMRDRERERLLRERQIQLRKQERSGSGDTVAQKEEAQKNKAEDKSNRKGILFGGGAELSGEEGAKKPSFWARLKRAIFGA